MTRTITDVTNDERFNDLSKKAAAHEEYINKLQAANEKLSQQMDE